MKKILVLGAGGMAGHMIALHLKQNPDYQVVQTIHTPRPDMEGVLLDVTDTGKLQALLQQEKPDVLINCIGMLIQGAKQHPARTVFINAYLPYLLKETLSQWQGKLIHISTDCVFSGKQGGYTEQDVKDAQDLYGQSKALGEIIDDVNLTIRTSIIGPELKTAGEGLLHWFLHQKEEVNGYKEAFWSGVTTLHLAQAILVAIEQNISGLYQLTNSQKISKLDLLLLFRKYSGKQIGINAVDSKKVDKSLINNRTDLSYKVPSYDKMVEELFQFMQAHKNMYTQYFNA